MEPLYLLVVRISFTQTGSHFARKCSSCDQPSEHIAETPIMRVSSSAMIKISPVK